MPTIDLGTTPEPSAATGLLADPTRRITITLPELQLVARHAEAPLPFDLRGPTASEAGSAAATLGGRLGQVPADADAAAYAATLAGLHDPETSLSRRGLLVDGAVEAGVLGAVGLLAGAEVALDLDVAVGGARAKAWHRQAGGAVATLATVDGIVFELAWCPVSRWSDELARVAVVPEAGAPQDRLATTVPDSGVPARVEVPYELVDAAAEAVRTGRADLISVLAADHAPDCRAGDGSPMRDVDVITLLSGLTAECRGRLRGLVADLTGGSVEVAGVVSWVLLADGWRALRPRGGSGLGRLDIARVEPADLGRELAPVLAQVVA